MVRLVDGEARNFGRRGIDLTAHVGSVGSCDGVLAEVANRSDNIGVKGLSVDDRLTAVRIAVDRHEEDVLGVANRLEAMVLACA